MHIKFEKDCSSLCIKMKAFLKTVLRDSRQLREGETDRVWRKREGESNMVLGKNFLRQTVTDLQENNVSFAIKLFAVP